MSFFKNIKKIHGLKSEIKTLTRAYVDVRTPTMTKLLIAVLIVAYVVSPIDILPDILPLLGITDDILIIPAIMWTLLPNTVLDEARRYVTAIDIKNPKNHHWILWSFGIAL